MADLDDFFAKKDRKKTKSKKFATPDEFVKKLEDTTKRNEVVKPRKEPQSTQQSDGGVETESGEQLHAPEEDEWRDFAEAERNVDYTGLKIQNVQLNDDDYSGSDGEGSDGDGEDGDGDKGAWKKVSGGGAEGKANSQAEKESSKSQKAASGLAASSTGRYVSPALRAPSLMPMRLKRDALPDINNEEYFPTLGDAKKEELRKKKNEPAFEEVKSGARFQRESDLSTNAPVSIGNRYTSLADS
ncbi:protein CDV3 homolog [Sitodiplosis mosellana]|uniref:protein CDV3 homolog n=1 Tax=Sitodiplosis mosellana TaxID=263140 RepID=UPI0024452A51|nr:protein CDV3 homolog [Sitodiplosis mosellana]